MDVESGKVPKPKTHVSAGDRVSYGTKLGTVQWFAATRGGYIQATVAWDDAESEQMYVTFLARVLAQGT
jgi:hypothetical protein